MPPGPGRGLQRQEKLRPTTAYSPRRFSSLTDPLDGLQRCGVTASMP